MKLRPTHLLASSLALAALGCGGRAQSWSQPADGMQAYGLTDAVILGDPGANRVVALAIDEDTQALTEKALPTGQQVLATAVGPGGGHLYLLSAGHRAQLGDTSPEEKPRLTIVDGTTNPATERYISLDLLSDPLDGLAIDPTEHWAVLYAVQGASSAFVTNPNALVIVDLTPPPAAKPPQQVVLHSFGGHPESLIFPPLLGLPMPSGPTHLLVAQSDQDFTLVSLDDPTKPEITVRLADATAVTSPHPAQVVFDDGDPARTDDARIGVRFDNLSTVMTMQLEPSTDPSGYTPTINVPDVGGVPSAIAFVRTAGGLRLATLQPRSTSAVLYDPVTTLTSTVTLPAAYQSLSLVTSSAGTVSAGAAAGPDVALLWNASTTVGGVAFWDLGNAQAFHSIEVVGIDSVVNGVQDVPSPNATLKVLSTVSNEFFILDLTARTATPLITTLGVNLSVSPTGQRVWAYQPGGTQLASTDLVSGLVHTLDVDTPLTSLFEISKSSDGKQHALVAVQGQGGVGATVFDADKPDEASRRIYGALLTEGLYENQ